MFDKIKSHAKINLALNITGKSKSLHKVESIIAFVTLHDEIYIKQIKKQNHQISFFGEFSKNINSKNTISKLLKILDDRNLLKKKFRIKINKKIPIKSGLGGGSMNAANILKYLLKKKLIKLSKKQVLKISKSIGEDVILGLNSSYLIFNSKNEVKQFKGCKNFFTLIIKPNFGCSTKDIYSRVRKFERSKLDKPKKKMFNYKFLTKMHNSLEPIVLLRYPKLKKLKSFLEGLSKPLFVRMTGSGSAIVAYFHTKKDCDKSMMQFRKQYKKHWCISSKTI